MALNWSIGKVADHEALWVQDCTSEDGTPMFNLNPVTDGLIWMTMIVEMGQITEANWKEFYRRCKLYEFYNGNYFWGEEITPAMIHRHIGLSTNVSSSLKNWNKRIAQWSKKYIEDTKVPDEKWKFVAPKQD